MNISIQKLSSKDNESERKLQGKILESLSKYVLRKSDDVVKSLESDINTKVEEAKYLKAELAKLKKTTDVKDREFRRLLILKRVLNKINTLREEGGLRGELLNKVKKLLLNSNLINEGSDVLLDLDERLSILNSEKGSKISYT